MKVRVSTVWRVEACSVFLFSEGALLCTEHPGATTWAQVNFTHPGHLSFFIYIVMMQLKPGWSMKGPPVNFRREAPTKAGFSNTPTTSGEQVTFFLG